MEVVTEETRTTRRLILSVAELAALQQGPAHSSNLGSMIHKALTTSNGHPATINPEQAELSVEEAPTPARRKISPELRKLKYGRCKLCGNEVSFAQMAKHQAGRGCHENRKLYRQQVRQLASGG